VDRPRRPSAAAGGAPRRAGVALALLTFALSSLVNNLATIVVVVPLTIAVCRELRIDPLPLVFVEIVASNLGGASTMIGDFPNMWIAARTGIGFAEFLVHLALW